MAKQDVMWDGDGSAAPPLARCCAWPTSANNNEWHWQISEHWQGQHFCTINPNIVFLYGVYVGASKHFVPLKVAADDGSKTQECRSSAEIYLG